MGVSSNGSMDLANCLYPGRSSTPPGARLVIAVDALTRRPDYVEGTAKDMARWIAELSELHATRKQRAQVTRRSLHVLTGVRSASRGVRCVQTIVVATSPLERIQAGMLGDNDKELRRLGFWGQSHSLQKNLQLTRLFGDLLNVPISFSTRCVRIQRG